MNFGKYIIPAFMLVILIYSLCKKVNIYETVVEGAENGLKTIKHILPTMIIILSAVSMLRASGVLEFFVDVFGPFAERIGIPSEIIPMVLLRPVSGSGSFGLLSDYLSTYGPDSRIGRIVSVIMGSTETTFYTLAVYFSETGMKNIKRAIPCAVIGDLVCVIIACLIIK